MYNPNRSNYKLTVINNKTGEVKMYLNAKDVQKEYRISHSTLYRCLAGIKSKRYDNDYKFIRCRVKVNECSN